MHTSALKLLFSRAHKSLMRHCIRRRSSKLWSMLKIIAMMCCSYTCNEYYEFMICKRQQGFDLQQQKQRFPQTFVIVEPPNVCTPRWTINSLSTTPIFFVLSPWKQYKKKQVYLESSPKRSRSCLDSEVMNLELLQYGLKDVRCLRT